MSNTSKKILIWGVVVILVLVTGILIVLGVMAPSGSQTPTFVATTAAPITSADHIEGDPTSTVSLIEYGDFECPACYDWQPIVAQILAAYGNKIEFVFRNFPLYEIHPYALLAAQVAEAANLQGKYWQMHDLLYKNQPDWTADTNLSTSTMLSQFFDGYAQSLGMNVAQFDQDVTSTQVVNRVQGDIASGNEAQINHTPTFFVNLQQIQNPENYAQFQSILNQALATAKS